jgi:hypothetical protein
MIGTLAGAGKDMTAAPTQLDDTLSANAGPHFAFSGTVTLSRRVAVIVLVVSGTAQTEFRKCGQIRYGAWPERE